MWASLLQGIRAVLFSAACPGCGEGGEGGRLCASCLEALPRLAREEVCSVCAEPLPRGGAGREALDRRCGECLEARAFTRVLALGPLEGRLHEAVLALKFGGREALARGLGERLGAEFAADLEGLDAVVPVPLGRRREKERGHNQAESIALGVSRALGRPLRAELLRRSRETAAQTSLTRAQRRANVRGAFTARPAAAGLGVLLVDDVVTTGATAEAAARALLRAGAARVVVLALARAGRPVPIRLDPPGTSS